jgi:hypothetical protein
MSIVIDRLVETTGTEIIGDDDIGHGITRRKNEPMQHIGPVTFVSLTRQIEHSECPLRTLDDNRSPRRRRTACDIDMIAWRDDELSVRFCSVPRIELECIRSLRCIRLCLDIPESIF